DVFDHGSQSSDRSPQSSTRDDGPPRAELPRGAQGRIRRCPPQHATTGPSASSLVALRSGSHAFRGSSKQVAHAALYRGSMGASLSCVASRASEFYSLSEPRARASPGGGRTDDPARAFALIG